ncbi:MAG TPA: helix-turn-helix transcriptional regulator [Alphaproteobacteria bacterium]|nr:helix-turn-helix transcriptional regulator [Alphaproteobacteria bacterium]
MSIAKAIVEKTEKRSESPDPIDIHVGQRLRLRRNLLGMSQEQLGNASDLTFQQIQKYERGANRMGASRLYQLGRLLNVPVAYFFEELPAHLTNPSQQGFSDNKQSPLEGAPSPDNEILQRRETLELIRAYYRITDPKQRRTVYDLIKSMAEGK